MLVGLIGADRGVAEAARLAGLRRRQTHYDWVRNDPTYATAVRDAIKLAGDRIERRVEDRIAAWSREREEEYRKRMMQR